MTTGCALCVVGKLTKYMLSACHKFQLAAAWGELGGFLIIIIIPSREADCGVALHLVWSGLVYRPTIHEEKRGRALKALLCVYLSCVYRFS